MTGEWRNLQSLVQKRVDVLVDSGQEVGVQVSAYHHGEAILEAYAGVADRATGRPLMPSTPIFSYSTGKGVTATVVHVLAERGEIDYDLRIAEVWPEFAQYGKDDVTLRHALTHTAGLPALPADITAADLADWDRMCAIVAESEPVWAAGTSIGYHAWTYGWLVGEVVRRVTGLTMAQALAEYVSGPLGVRDALYFAVPEPDLGRLARLEDHNWSEALRSLSASVPNLDRVAPPGVRPDADLANRRDILSADVPATGTMSARGVARMYAALMGDVDGVRLISPERLHEVSRTAAHGTDWVFGETMTNGLGYAVMEDGAVFGTSGIGGSLAYAFPEQRLAVAATKNLLAFGEGDPMEDLCAFIREAVG
jgi:CubicO group peptidase (beta-lactamase class C family)